MPRVAATGPPVVDGENQHAEQNTQNSADGGGEHPEPAVHSSPLRTSTVRSNPYRLHARPPGVSPPSDFSNPARDTAVLIVSACHLSVSARITSAISNEVSGPYARMTAWMSSRSSGSAGANNCAAWCAVS